MTAAIEYISLRDLRKMTFPTLTRLNSLAPRISHPAISVEEELLSRDRCRYGLRDVQVLLDNKGRPLRVLDNWWDKNGYLRVHIEGNLDAPACRLALASPWPVCCCTPSHRHRFNSVGRKWIRNHDHP